MSYAFDRKTDNVDDVLAADVNELQVAIEELGDSVDDLETAPVQNYPCQGRLTLESGVAVSTADQSAKATVYFTPHKGNKISLYDGANWADLAFTEKGIALAGYTANKNYDVWGYNSAGALALNSSVWTNNTTRAIALVLQDGVLVKSGTPEYRYLGTIRINSTGGQCEDTLLFRGVWNNQNRVARPMIVIEATASWSYGTATWRQMRAQAANKVEFVVGVEEYPVQARQTQRLLSELSTIPMVGIGLDATDALSSKANQGVFHCSAATSSATVVSVFYGFTGIGYHYLAPIEFSSAGAPTFYANSINQIFEGVIYG